MAKEIGRKPEWIVSVLDKNTEKRGPVGAGWDNDDGSISIRFHMCTVIDTRTQDLVITLFPNKPRGEED